MKLIVESTSKVVEINGMPCRIWEGTTESGIKVHAFMIRVAISAEEEDDVHGQFKKELQECKAPSAELNVYPLRMII
jgi:hypothetical protein